MTNPFVTKLTCQICGGTFNALEGYIANHGHKKVKGVNGRKGYITQGCAGSRERPFENSRDVIPSVIASWSKEIEDRNDHLAAILEAEDYIRDEGYDIDGYSINECDLDRRGKDAGATKEEREEIFEDIRYHMAQIGIPHYQYGSMTFEQFYDHLIKRQERLIDQAVHQRDAFKARYNDWVQTISDDEWDHNRNTIMGEKRTAATFEAWETRRYSGHESFDEVKRGETVEVETVHQPMILKEFGIVVARFTTVPAGTKVFEAVPNDNGTWDVIDTHADWETVEKMFGDALIPA